MQRSNQGTDVLTEALDLVTNDRQSTYGHPYDDYTKVVSIFGSLTGVQLDVMQAILFMVSVKLARLRTNLERDVLHRDTLVDTIGYLTCLNMAREAQDGVSK